MRILSFSGCQPDQFHPDEGEDNHLEALQEAACPVVEKAVSVQVAEADLAVLG